MANLLDDFGYEEVQQTCTLTEDFGFGEVIATSTDDSEEVPLGLVVYNGRAHHFLPVCYACFHGPGNPFIDVDKEISNAYSQTSVDLPFYHHLVTDPDSLAQSLAPFARCVVPLYHDGKFVGCGVFLQGRTIITMFHMFRDRGADGWQVRLDHPLSLHVQRGAVFQDLRIISEGQDTELDVLYMRVVDEGYTYPFSLDFSKIVADVQTKETIVVMAYQGLPNEADLATCMKYLVRKYPHESLVKPTLSHLEILLKPKVSFASVGSALGWNANHTVLNAAVTLSPGSSGGLACVIRGRTISPFGLVRSGVFAENYNRLSCLGNVSQAPLVPSPTKLLPGMIT